MNYDRLEELRGDIQQCANIIMDGATDLDKELFKDMWSSWKETRQMYENEIEVLKHKAGGGADSKANNMRWKDAYEALQNAYKGLEDARMDDIKKIQRLEFELDQAKMSNESVAALSAKNKELTQKVEELEDQIKGLERYKNLIERTKAVAKKNAEAFKKNPALKVAVLQPVTPEIKPTDEPKVKEKKRKLRATPKSAEEKRDIWAMFICGVDPEVIKKKYGISQATLYRKVKEYDCEFVKDLLQKKYGTAPLTDAQKNRLKKVIHKPYMRGLITEQDLNNMLTQKAA